MTDLLLTVLQTQVTYSLHNIMNVNSVTDTCYGHMSRTHCIISFVLHIILLSVFVIAVLRMK